MIHFLYGENNYFVRQKMQEIIASWPDDAQIERYDGETLDIDQLPIIFQTLSLFSSKKYIILSRCVDNKSVWAELPGYLESMVDNEVVIVEESPDKRTKSFKFLEEHAEVFVAAPLQKADAVRWFQDEAARQDIVITPTHSRQVVDRVGTDAWQLYFALQSLSVAPKIDDALIDTLLPARIEESIFSLLDAAFAGSVERVQTLVNDMQGQQDPYQFFGLLSQQIFQLSLLVTSEQSPTHIAKSIGVHPFPLQKLAPIATKISHQELKKIITLLAECDDDIKRSGVEPWLLIEQTLIKLALVCKR